MLQAMREIIGKTHMFWFDWGPAGKLDFVGVRSLVKKPLNDVFDVVG